jgi:hypothetical protein
MKNSPSTTSQWYDKTWLVILLCFLFFPTGLYALWKSSRYAIGWKIGVSAFFALFLIAAIVSDPPKEATASSAEPVKPSEQIPVEAAAQPLTWQIVNTDSSNQQLTFRITISDRTEDKAQLIEIARKLKAERDWAEKLVCFFDIKVPSHTFAWASVGYLPNCESCPTDKDSDGTSVEYRLIGMRPGMADSLRLLTLDSIPNKTLVAAYLEDVAKCKTALYRVDAAPTKLLKAQLFQDGGNIVESLSLKEAGGQKRYYFPGDDEGIYLVIDEGSHAVNFYNSKGEWWQSVAMEL